MIQSGAGAYLIRWWAWSSKPLNGLNAVDRFDSDTFPPARHLHGQTPPSTGNCGISRGFRQQAAHSGCGGVDRAAIESPSGVRQPERDDDAPVAPRTSTTAVANWAFVLVGTQVNVFAAAETLWAVAASTAFRASGHNSPASSASPRQWPGPWFSALANRIAFGL